jgi:hypothetical protein
VRQAAAGIAVDDVDRDGKQLNKLNVGHANSTTRTSFSSIIFMHTLREVSGFKARTVPFCTTSSNCASGACVWMPGSSAMNRVVLKDRL